MSYTISKAQDIVNICDSWADLFLQPNINEYLHLPTSTCETADQYSMTKSQAQQF